MFGRLPDFPSNLLENLHTCARCDRHVKKQPSTLRGVPLIAAPRPTSRFRYWMCFHGQTFPRSHYMSPETAQLKKMVLEPIPATLAECCTYLLNLLLRTTLLLNQKVCCDCGRYRDRKHEPDRPHDCADDFCCEYLAVEQETYRIGAESIE